MKLIENKIEKLEQKYDLLGIYEQIEIAGRTAYKSLDKIKYDDNYRSITAKDFVEKMVKMGHGSTLEHGTVYLILPENHASINIYNKNPYSFVSFGFKDDKYVYVTTNYRVLVENNLLEDLDYLSEPKQEHIRRHTFRLTCARVQADSFVRHRVFSFLMESTRYCNYSDGKFNKEITIVKPVKWDELGGNTKLLKLAWGAAEYYYMQLIKNRVEPEDARDLLPLQLKTELIMTGTTGQWS